MLPITLTRLKKKKQSDRDAFPRNAGEFGP